MINRVLIRIKVVQLLYSYLLTRSDFQITTLPEGASRDRRFAQRVYIAVLEAILHMCGHKAPAGLAANSRLSQSMIGQSLASNADLRRLADDDPEAAAMLDGLLPALMKEISSSAPYRSYTHTRERDIPEDVKFWVTTLRTLVANSPAFEEACRRSSDFTVEGMKSGLDMAVATLEGVADNRLLFTGALRSLDASLDKARELYFALLWLPVELTRMQDERLETARNKYLPSEADLNPNLRFVDNTFVRALAESPEIAQFRKDFPFSWDNEETMLRSLLDKIVASEEYARYMAAPPTDAAADAEFWRSMFRTVILPSDELAEALENKSVYWNDDLHIIGTFVLKSIKQYATGSGDSHILRILPKFKDEEDARFGAELFTYVVKNRQTYRGYIDRFLHAGHWDSDRLALMDIIIMMTAIAEMLNFPAIPIPVTLNEYIEIANNYSTPRSGHFINGILYSVINYLREEKLLMKQ